MPSHISVLQFQFLSLCTNNITVFSIQLSAAGRIECGAMVRRQYRIQYTVVLIRLEKHKLRTDCTSAVYNCTSEIGYGLCMHEKTHLYINCGLVHMNTFQSVLISGRSNAKEDISEISGKSTNVWLKF